MPRNNAANSSMPVPLDFIFTRSTNPVPYLEFSTISSEVDPMKPAPFTYAAPTSVDEVIALLDTHGEAAKLLAGGQSLAPMMNLRLASPAYIIDLNRLEGLDYIEERDGLSGHWGDDATARTRALGGRAPTLSAAGRSVPADWPSGHPQPRDRGGKHCACRPPPPSCRRSSSPTAAV